MILSSFAWVQYQRVTDGQTDGRTDRIVVANTAVWIASNAAALQKRLERSMRLAWRDEMSASASVER